MTVLVTGAAGFIGFHLCKKLTERGETVLGLDNLSDYYSPSLKIARLGQLEPMSAFSFVEADVANRDALAQAVSGHEIDGIVHLAAQAGVRYSLENPRSYLHSNLTGHLEMLELARNLPDLKHFVYASSSSVYGDADRTPFSESDRADRPCSLYAATKRADELMSFAYASLFGIPQTGLRFFTVFGPWGRPDMAYWSFTRAIIEGEPVHLYGNGEALRDFTYIDDVIAGTVSALDRPPADQDPPHRVYNLGNNRPISVAGFLGILETAIGKRANRILEPLPPGDVPVTCADIEAAARDLGYQPKTDLESGLRRFVDWYVAYGAGIAPSDA